jgi:pimeloyl-ACP methyl ester carboxylesterase
MDRIPKKAEELSLTDRAAKPDKNPRIGTGGGQSVVFDGLRFCYERQGQGGALVLVHGLLGYSFSWRHVLPLFARTWEVFAPDLPGAGYSDCDPKLDCRLSSAATRLVSFLDAVGIVCCDLVGSSYGGATIMMMAALAPLRVRRLVLVSPVNPWSRYGRVKLSLFENALIAALFPPLARSTRSLDRHFLAKLYGEPGRLTDEALAGYQGPFGRPGIIEHAVKTVKTWSTDMGELTSVLERLSNIPTLLLWGTRDRAVDPASAAPLGRILGNAEVAVIEGAGHLPYEEYPEEFSRIVGEFLLRPR